MKHFRDDAYGSPVVEYLWNLSSSLIGPIAAQTTCAEGERYTIRALNGCHASIPISCSTAIVS